MLDVSSINNFFSNQKHSIDEKNGTLRLNFDRYHGDLKNTNLLPWLAANDVTLNKITLLRIDETTDKTANSPHADTVPGIMTVLVPLEFQATLATITFKSFYNGSNKRGYKYRPNKQQYYHDEWLSNDDSFVTGITQKEFDQTLYQQYFGVLPIENYYGLEIDNIFEWSLGRPIKFPANQLHAAGNLQSMKRFFLCHYYG